MAKSDFRKVGNYGDATEAEHICSILAENDVAAFVDGAHANSWMPHVGSALGGVSLYVNNEDAERAFEIIGSLDGGINKNAAPWFCDPCQVEVEGGFEVCWSCGQPRSEVECQSLDTAKLVDPVQPDAENIDRNTGPESLNPYAAPTTEIVDESLGVAPASKDQPSINDAAERMLLYAFRASIIGLICLPVIAHFYSMYLLLRASSLGTEFTAKGSSRFTWAVLINIASVVAWGYLFSR